MSENTNHHQLELFSHQQDNFTPAQKRGVDFAFLKRVRANEKVLLLVFAFIVTSIVSFSIGVNNGKRLALVSPADTLGSGVKTPHPAPDKPAAIKIQPLPKETPPSGMAALEGSAEKFTIQLASYSSAASAEKEAALLKKKGFAPLVVTKGKYTVLCVGNFPQRQQAKDLLAEFAKDKRYKGCYVRRL